MHRRLWLLAALCRPLLQITALLLAAAAAGLLVGAQLEEQYLEKLQRQRCRRVLTH